MSFLYKIQYVSLVSIIKWDEHRGKMQYDKLLNTTSDPDGQELCSSGSGDWLHAMPLLSVGLKLNNVKFKFLWVSASYHNCSLGPLVSFLA